MLDNMLDNMLDEKRYVSLLHHNIFFTGMARFTGMTGFARMAAPGLLCLALCGAAQAGAPLPELLAALPSPPQDIEQINQWSDGQSVTHAGFQQARARLKQEFLRANGDASAAGEFIPSEGNNSQQVGTETLADAVAYLRHFPDDAPSQKIFDNLTLLTQDRQAMLGGFQAEYDRLGAMRRALYEQTRMLIDPHCARGLRCELSEEGKRALTELIALHQEKVEAELRARTGTLGRMRSLHHQWIRRVQPHLAATRYGEMTMPPTEKEVVRKAYAFSLNTLLTFSALIEEDVIATQQLAQMLK